MKRHQAAVQAAEILPLLFLKDDTKVGAIAQYAAIEVLHGDR
jgi:hypothetical protein